TWTASLVASNTPNTETVAEATKEAVQVLEPATPNFEAAKTESPKLQNPNLPKSAALKLDWIKPLIAGPLPRNEASAGTKTAARQRRNRKLALVAAALGTAAGLGALLGALAASAPSFPAPAEAAALSTRTEDGLAATIAQLRADVTALKVSVE